MTRELTDVQLNQDISALMAYVQSLDDFQVQETYNGDYGHMGATITNAVDRHLYAFLADAGISISTYQQAKAILDGAADRLGVSRNHFDHSVWQYMSSRAHKS